MKNLGFIFVAALIGLLVVGGAILFTQQEIVNNLVDRNSPLISPLGTIEKKLEEIKPQTFDTNLSEDTPINILLLGIDRRSRAELYYRTDIMILMSLNLVDKRVVFTSVPRDLWYSGSRINAVYQQSGWSGMQNAFETITGQQPDRYILTDFKDFAWVVDAMGGVTVDVETSFTDRLYPVDITKTYQTVSFTKGPEKMTGERALIFARSRKGDFDNGDFGRMKRQHLLLKSMPEAVLQPDSIFNPMIVADALETVTKGKMDTNLKLGDAEFLWSFYGERDKYTYHSLFLDSKHLYNPPLSEYGGAWVLVPRSGSYSAFHQEVENAIYGVGEAAPQLDGSGDLQ